jgi:hypothetical protein
MMNQKRLKNDKKLCSGVLVLFVTTDKQNGGRAGRARSGFDLGALNRSNSSL